MNPYLWPNFHSVSDKSSSLARIHNRCAFSSQLEYNGSGAFSRVNCAKNNTIANFYALSPTLPYFVNRSRIHNNFIAKNCLVFCNNSDTDFLITSDQKNKIFGILIEDNKVSKSENYGQTQSKPHTYSADQSVSYGPFRYCTQKICDLFVDEEEESQDFRPIFELKVHRIDENESQIQSNSRNKIRFFSFNCEQQSDPVLDVFCELKVENHRRSDDSLFENCERNELIDNQLLISYTKDNVIDLYDWETNQTIRSFDSFEEQIGLSWAQNHPKMFFTGDHKRLNYCDSRSYKTVLEFLTKKTDNTYEWEMFYQFLPSKLHPNQVFVATDFHIIIADWRYLNKNVRALSQTTFDYNYELFLQLLQLNHLIPKNIVRSLKSLEVIVDNKSTELLVISNLHQNCLMSFSSSGPAVSLSSNHLPLHLSTPKDIDKKFENFFYRGIELIDSKDSTGFSSPVLTNSGDIFIQDFFWCTSNEQLTANDGEKGYEDRTYYSGVGSLSLQLDPKTAEYIEEINSFLFSLKNKIQANDDYVNHCIICKLRRVCKTEDNECLCRHDFDYTGTVQTTKQRTPSPEIDRKALVDEICLKHFGDHIMETKQRLEDKEHLEKTSDKYTKSVLKYWKVFGSDTTE